nr:unnamed protein product [Spirometra erinaceieuropaei]
MQRSLDIFVASVPPGLPLSKPKVKLTSLRRSWLAKPSSNPSQHARAVDEHPASTGVVGHLLTQCTSQTTPTIAPLFAPASTLTASSTMTALVAKAQYPVPHCRLSPPTPSSLRRHLRRRYHHHHSFHSLHRL